MDADFAACLAKRNVTRGILLEQRDFEEQFKQLDKDNDPALGCVMACIMERSKQLENGIIDRTKVIEYSKGRFSRLEMPVIPEEYLTCIDNANKIPNVCEKSLSFERCIRSTDWHVKKIKDGVTGNR
ncbi:hypothetical protein QAD02_023388 [Eretmocerus hayati]|uniref:Uncharacterized protein n=1 Tax=Eretmocerus hayati TaxID=131215 RepID=A0ACC2PVG4_9HYME|nr:hypothetical protein QAD02_023388 [Eretmocerus hayati]